MQNVTLSPCQIAAAITWMATIPLAIATAMMDEVNESIHVGVVTVIVLIVAATLTIRGFFVKWEGLMRNAFALGRDSALDEELRRIA